MTIEFKRSWSDSDLEAYRDSVARFVESELLPHDEEARERGHVGHAVWRSAGALGFLCTDIPEQYGGAGGDFRHEAVFKGAERAHRHEPRCTRSRPLPAEPGPRHRSGRICRLAPGGFVEPSR
jgi:alkylation response protein AidB-like acyl-CoA dehydrogenase